jgi:hypothetical protein
VLLNGSAATCAIVDSGADACIFPLSVMRELQLDQAIGRPSPILHPFTGARVDVLYFRVQLHIVRLNPILTEVGFTDTKIGYGTLGQRGFFDRFDVAFFGAEQYFEITARSD